MTKYLQNYGQSHQPRLYFTNVSITDALYIYEAKKFTELTIYWDKYALIDLTGTASMHSVTVGGTNRKSCSIN